MAEKTPKLQFRELRNNPYGRNMMFRFIHTFTEKSLKGLFESGLWHEGNGMKLMHKTYIACISADKQFNEIAKPGSMLYQILDKLRCPFYIDRFMGGVPLPVHYDYNPSLIEQYKEMLGDNFLGFQMHEWMSNFANENRTVMNAERVWNERYPGAPLSEMWKAYVDEAKSNPMAFDFGAWAEEKQAGEGKLNLAPLLTEAWSVEEWSGMKHPANLNEFLSECRRLWALRTGMVNSLLFPADSYFVAPKLEIELGAKMLLPEIGWQIPGTRFQIAYTRGMARSAEIPWGVYYECWACNDAESGVLTIPYSSDSADNEWAEEELREQMVRATNGRIENGGSSRSLQERSWIYAYFSGASIMGEEYGECNTFRNFNDFELSEYGLVKKRFLDFVESHPDMGTAYTPIAIVLPAELPAVTLNEGADRYMGYKMDGNEVDSALSDKIRKVREVLGKLLFEDIQMSSRPGKDDHCIQNGKYPDVFDVIHADSKTLDQYEYLIDLTGDEAFAKAHDNCIRAENVDQLLERLLPCTLDHQLHYAFNKTEDGWLMLVINNHGVLRSSSEGDVFQEEAAICSDIHLRAESGNIDVVDGTGILSCEDGKYSVTMGAGQWLIVAIH